jgi:GNAT superfamily N-acetyltransferase
MKIRPAVSADAAKISSLIHLRSHLLTVDPTGEGAEGFFASIRPDAIQRYISSQNFSYLVAEEKDHIVGVAALRDNRHLFNLFVDYEVQGKGLGRRLWRNLRDSALQAGNDGEFTVNASLNSLEIYRHLGFVEVGAPVEANGVAFVPMKLQLSNCVPDQVTH